MKPYLNISWLVNFPSHLQALSIISSNMLPENTTGLIRWFGTETRVDIIMATSICCDNFIGQLYFFHQWRLIEIANGFNLNDTT